MENLIFSSLNIETRMFSKKYWWGEAEPIAITAVRRRSDTSVGYIRNVRFQNINCSGENGILIYGDASMNIQSILFDGVHVRLRRVTNHPTGYHDLRPNEGNVILEDSLHGVYARNAKDICFHNFSLEAESEMQKEMTEPVSIENCENVRMNP